MFDYQANAVCAQIIQSLLSSVPEAERHVKAEGLAREAGLDEIVSKEFAEHVLGYPSYKK